MKQAVDKAGVQPEQVTAVGISSRRKASLPGRKDCCFNPSFPGNEPPGGTLMPGAPFGVGLHHRKEHFVRAVLERVGFSILSVGKALEEQTGPARDIRISGGFVRFPLWPQILCDVLGRALSIPESEEASAFGAAFLSLFALGEVKSLQEVQEYIRIRQRLQPDPSKGETYRQLYPIYELLYARLEEEYEALLFFNRIRRLLISTKTAGI